MWGIRLNYTIENERTYDGWAREGRRKSTTPNNLMLQANSGLE